MYSLILRSGASIVIALREAFAVASWLSRSANAASSSLMRFLRAVLLSRNSRTVLRKVAISVSIGVGSFGCCIGSLKLYLPSCTLVVCVASFAKCFWVTLEQFDLVSLAHKCVLNVGIAE